MKKFSLSIWFCFLWLISLSAQENGLSRLKQANQHYEKAEYEESISIYQKLLEENYSSDDLHYNLGNAFFKNNQIAAAILHYEKALKINPGHDDAAYNLKIANEKTIDKIEPIPELFIYRWWKAIFNLFSVDQWAYLMVITFVISLVMLSIYFFNNQINLKKVGFYAACILIVFALFSWFMAYKHYNYLHQTQHAIIMEPTVNINSSPSPGSSKLFVLHEGTKVKVEEASDEWYKVSLPNGNEGWIEQSMVAEI